MAEIFDHIRDIFIGHKFKALFKYRFALIIHHIIIFQQVFTAVKMLLLDADLRALNGFGHETVSQLFAFFPAHCAHHRFKTVTAENPH